MWTGHSPIPAQETNEHESELGKGLIQTEHASELIVSYPAALNFYKIMTIKLETNENVEEHNYRDHQCLTF